MDEMQRPIGVFDSGVGGISVLRELVALMPNENFIFYGDSKNAPYGTKTLEEVRKLTLADAEYLRSRNAFTFRDLKYSASASVSFRTSSKVFVP